MTTVFRLLLEPTGNATWLKEKTAVLGKEVMVWRTHRLRPVTPTSGRGFLTC